MSTPKQLLLGASLLAAVACNGSVGGPTPGRHQAENQGSAGAVAAGGSGAVSTPRDAPFVPAPPALPRLTTAQYRAVIADLFGPSIPIGDLEPDQRPYSFSIIGASTTTVSERGVEQYGNSAFGIAHAVFADSALRQRVVGCAPATPLDDACLRSFIKRFGLKAWRRPLSEDEVTRYHALASAIGLSEPWSALEYVTAGLLQSPHFLYRVELGEPDAERPGWRRYTSYEMASRLSFLLRNSYPDAELLAAAAAGALDTASGVSEQAQRLLNDVGPTETMVRALYSEYLDLPLLKEVQFPAELDPSRTLADSMAREVLDLVSRVALRDDADMRTLFDTRRAAVNADLARLYGGTATSSELLPLEHAADGPRAGLLTTGALLTLNNRPNRTSPTIRGFFIRQRLLCGTVPPPPPGIPPIKEEEAGAPRTIREKLEQHRSDPACSACHRLMDPIGLGMEDFDQFGRFRTTYDEGQPVDSAGDVDGVTFDGARQLGELLAADPRVMSCLVKQLYRYGSARLETEGEAPALARLNEAFGADGYRFEPLLLELVRSDGFRYTMEGTK